MQAGLLQKPAAGVVCLQTCMVYQAEVLGATVCHVTVCGTQTHLPACCCSCHCALCCCLMQAQDPLLFGNGAKHIPKLVTSFVDVLGRGTQLVDEPLGRRIAALVSSMRPNLPADLVDGAFNALSDKQKHAVTAYFTGVALPQQ